LFLDFMVQGTIMEAEALLVRADANPSKLMVPLHPSSPIFTSNAIPAATLPICPGLGQAPNYDGFVHTQWLRSYLVAWLYPVVCETSELLLL